MKEKSKTPSTNALLIVKHWLSPCLPTLPRLGNGRDLHCPVHYVADWKKHHLRSVSHERWGFISKANSILLQNWPFFHLFYFLFNVDEGNVFYDILEQKNAFLGYKKVKFKTSKNWDFPKGGSSMVLVQNWPFIYLSFFRQC